jgi:GT2 family glycosyltransferase
MNPRVVAVVATFRRPKELARLIGSLAGVESMVICDNSADGEIRKIAASSGVPAYYLSPGTNLGCGGGLRLAEEHAWKITNGQLTHLLVLDDDAVLAPDTIPALCASLDRENAVAAYPLVLGEDGRVGWLPGLHDRHRHRLGKRSMLPGEYRSRLGVAVDDFVWAQGVCLLVRREAIAAVGFHRADFWVRGEDLDFSLRLTAHGRGIFVPSVEVFHLPPPVPAAHGEAEYLRHAAMLQNIAYLGFCQPHGVRIRGSLAGASLRFVRTWGAHSLADLWRAIWRGTICRQPAGQGEGRTFLQRFHEIVARP